MALSGRVWGVGKVVILAAALVATFVVFFGAAARIALRSRDVVVPPLTGTTVNAASTSLADLGLTLRVEEGRRLDPKVPEGRIVAQEPAAGSVTRRPRSVKAWLSAGARASVVPSLVGVSERFGLAPTPGRWPDPPPDGGRAHPGLPARRGRRPMAAARGQGRGRGPPGESRRAGRHLRDA